MYLAATLDTPGSLKAVGRGRGGEDVDFADCAQRSDSDQKVSLFFFYQQITPTSIALLRIYVRDQVTRACDRRPHFMSRPLGAFLIALSSTGTGRTSR